MRLFNLKYKINHNFKIAYKSKPNNFKYKINNKKQIHLFNKFRNYKIIINVLMKRQFNQKIFKINKSSGFSIDISISK